MKIFDDNLLRRYDNFFTRLSSQPTRPRPSTPPRPKPSLRLPLGFALLFATPTSVGLYYILKKQPQQPRDLADERQNIVGRVKRLRTMKFGWRWSYSAEQQSQVLKHYKEQLKRLVARIRSLKGRSTVLEDSNRTSFKLPGLGIGFTSRRRVMDGIGQVWTTQTSAALTIFGRPVFARSSRQNEGGPRLLQGVEFDAGQGCRKTFGHRWLADDKESAQNYVRCLLQTQPLSDEVDRLLQELRSGK